MERFTVYIPDIKPHTCRSADFVAVFLRRQGKQPADRQDYYYDSFSHIPTFF